MTTVRKSTFFPFKFIVLLLKFCRFAWCLLSYNVKQTRRVKDCARNTRKKGPDPDADTGGGTDTVQPFISNKNQNISLKTSKQIQQGTCKSRVQAIGKGPENSETKLNSKHWEKHEKVTDKR